jgi:hypothetical protein
MWLSLTEYSNKHRVSISTLRRKIKSTEIQFRLDDGKYMILDSEENKFMDEGPSVNSFSEQNRPSLKSEIKPEINNTKPEPQTGESVITAANRLLADLKKAYTQVLQDKEAQISELREEMMDLKTLIKVLESENSRLANKFNN